MVTKKLWVNGHSGKIFICINLYINLISKYNLILFSFDEDVALDLLSYVPYYFHYCFQDALNCFKKLEQNGIIEHLQDNNFIIKNIISF